MVSIAVLNDLERFWRSNVANVAEAVIYSLERLKNGDIEGAQIVLKAILALLNRSL